MLNNNSFHSRIGSGSVFALHCDPAFQSTFKRDRLCLAPRRFSEATAASINAKADVWFVQWHTLNGSLPLVWDRYPSTRSRAG